MFTTETTKFLTFILLFQYYYHCTAVRNTKRAHFFFFPFTDAAQWDKTWYADSAAVTVPLYFIPRLKYVLDNAGGSGRLACKAL